MVDLFAETGRALGELRRSLRIWREEKEEKAGPAAWKRGGKREEEEEEEEIWRIFLLKQAWRCAPSGEF